MDIIGTTFSLASNLCISRTEARYTINDARKDKGGSYQICTHYISATAIAETGYETHTGDSTIVAGGT
jgi:hypothetical protein